MEASIKKTRARGRLSPALILTAAFKVIEQEGLEGFSMRKLAAELGCEAMSIYHHFPSKAHLMDALVDRFIATIELPQGELAWQDRLRRLTASWRGSAMKQPEFFRYFVIHRLNTAAGLKFLDAMLSIYFDAGFDDEHAARFFRLTGYYVTGGLLDETSGYARGPSAVQPPGKAEIARDYPRIAAAAPFFQRGAYEKTLDVGLDILIAGFERELVKTRDGR